MPRKKWIDKSTATTFQLVHRPQDDPLQHDEASSSQVFRPLAPSQAHKIKSRNDLEADLFGSSSDPSESRYHIRDNEGEAAENGVYFDDTEYDYMQHIRDLNANNADTEAYFVEAKEGKNRGKAKAKMSLEDALRESSLHDEQPSPGPPTDTRSLMGSESASLSSSSNALHRGIETQQDIPDALAGFQPDMDPRLREVLEALDDEAYVEDEEEEFFSAITQGRQELSLSDFQDTLYNDFTAEDDDDDDDDGWESDATEKPHHEYTDSSEPPERLSEADLTLLNAPLSDVPDVDSGCDQAMTDADSSPSHPDQAPAWLAEFSKFKQAQAAPKKPRLKTPALDADLQSSILTSTSLASGRKKRKGAMTSSTGFSMTSSSLARTEGLTTLDRRFDRIEEEYAEMPPDSSSFFEDDGDDDGGASIVTKNSIASKASTASRVSTASRLSTASELSNAPSLFTGTFDAAMDEFLGGYQVHGKGGKRVKRGGYQTGMEQLDEVRRGLGPARVGEKKATFI